MSITLTLEGLPGNMSASTTTSSRYEFAGRRPTPCALMEVVINLDPARLDVPCFRCSRFLSEDDYYKYYELNLTVFIRRAVFRGTPMLDCAFQIAREIVSRILIPVNCSDDYNCMTHRVHLQIRGAQSPVNRALEPEPEPEPEPGEEQQEQEVVVGSSFEEVGPKRRPCSIESEIEMFMARGELKALEGENAERDWKESGNGHDCAICLEEIESVWESLQSPCTHVFHDKCVLRWFDDNNVCPVCRFELPFEEEIA